jgi:threonylcarbamoyladenosine tRNA methylthiotransferase MtaB
VTTDVIAGFPGETDADHEATLALVRESQFTDAHVFPFSKRPGTSAAHFEDQIDAATRARRAAEIRQITARQATQFRLASIGQLRLVLWEGSRGATGLTDNYLRVRLEDADSAASWAGDGDGLIEQVKLTSLARDGIMTAVPA